MSDSEQAGTKGTRTEKQKKVDSFQMSSSLRKLKEKIENKNKKPRKKYTLNRDDGPQCDVCLRRFASNQSLCNHKARIHDGKTSKDFECLKCHKRFSYKSNLTMHDKIVHLKLREHVCKVCGRAFGLNYDLQKHIRMRHDKVRSAGDGDGESDGSEDETVDYGESDGSEDETVDDPFPEDTAAQRAPTTTSPDSGPAQAAARLQVAPTVLRAFSAAQRVQTTGRS